jgi:hypothetical protein
VHSPACVSWEEHVEKAFSAIRDGDEYDLFAFVDFLQHSWDNERLADDPEFVPGGRETAA